ncbi:MAG: FHA domain-containing protein [Treponema sp.]|nr:FHA domain-containing protein [Treponema sp.]
MLVAIGCVLIFIGVAILIVPLVVKKINRRTMSSEAADVTRVTDVIQKKEEPIDDSEQKELQAESQTAETQQMLNPYVEKNTLCKNELFLIVDDAVYPIGEKISIGRSTKCDVVIADPLVSRYHCKLGKVFGDYVIEDKHSTNGTLLNDKPVPEDEYRKIKSGDKITMGNTTLLIK